LTLPADYLQAAEHRARQFSGAYTGTSGTLAADVLHLLTERASMTATIDKLTAENQSLRDAVEARLAGGVIAAEAACCEGGRCHPEEVEEPTDIDEPETPTIPSDWILQGERELKSVQPKPVDIRQLGAGLLADGIRPGSREFLAVLDELKDLHMKKTLDYGVDEDALSNIRSSADVVNMPAWAGCILRISDKMHRLKAFFRRGKCEFDGVEDTLKDIACYAAIALVLHRETYQP